MSLPTWLCPPASFGLVTSQMQKALPKGTNVGAARPAALCLVAAPTAEPSKSSQGEGQEWIRSKRGATLGASQHRETEASQAPQGGTE